MKFYIIASFITTFLLLSCKKEAEVIPENRWQLSISNIDDDGATLTWNKMIDTTSSFSFYKILIDNKLISDSVINTNYEITNLKHKTVHQLKLLVISNHIFGIWSLELFGNCILFLICGQAVYKIFKIIDLFGWGSFSSEDCTTNTESVRISF